MILIVDNTENLKKAYMTPLIIDYLKNKNIQTHIFDAKKDSYKTVFDLSLKCIILSGGPLLLSQDCDNKLLDNNVAIIHHFKGKIPILGICLGCQIISFLYGGYIYLSSREYKGTFQANKITNDSVLLHNFPTTFQIYLEHKDLIILNNRKFTITSKCDNIIMSIENKKEKLYGTQFHPEALQSTIRVIENFLTIC